MNQPQPLSETDTKYQTILHELMDMGTDIARTIHKQATTQNPTDAPTTTQPQHPSPDPILQFDRIARTIRRTIALARDLANPPKPATPYNPAKPPIQDRTQARKHIFRRVEDRIRSETQGDRATNLREELYDRMDTPDLEDDIATRPAEDIVRDICNDLGLGNVPGHRRSPAEVQALAAAAAHPTTSGANPVRPAPRPNHKPPSQAEQSAQRQSDIALMHKLLGKPPQRPQPS